MTYRVLVVEDDALVREALGQTLELEGHDPILAGSFILAKDHIAQDFDGIVLSDIRMPGRDGLFLLDHAQSVDPDLPVARHEGHSPNHFARVGNRNGSPNQVVPIETRTRVDGPGNDSLGSPRGNQVGSRFVELDVHGCRATAQ